jgi:hypothetical protein
MENVEDFFASCADFVENRGFLPDIVPLCKKDISPDMIYEIQNTLRGPAAPKSNCMRNFESAFLLKCGVFTLLPPDQREDLWAPLNYSEGVQEMFIPQENCRIVFTSGQDATAKQRKIAIEAIKKAANQFEKRGWGTFANHIRAFLTKQEWDFAHSNVKKMENHAPLHPFNGADINLGDKPHIPG